MTGQHVPSEHSDEHSDQGAPAQDGRQMLRAQKMREPRPAPAALPAPQGSEPVNVEAIKRAHPLLTVLDHYGIATRGLGARRTALCPFHDDHAPSFTVFLESDRFHCFGCGARGDVIELVERLEGVSFLEAVRRLETGAISWQQHDRGSPGSESSLPYGIAPQPSALELFASEDAGSRHGDGGDASGPGGRADMGAVPPLSSCGLPWHPLPVRLALLTTAAALYRETLLHAPQATAYLASRGVSPALARAACLGYADGMALERFLVQAPALWCAARRLGLMDAYGRESLRGRLIIPEMRDGLCVWLHGRSLVATPNQEGAHAQATPSTWPTARRRDPPKYLGCALEKPLLGAGLYDLRAGDPHDVHSHATQGFHHRPLQRGIVVVEGSFDFLTIVGWHIPIPCVALVGTHASPTQLRHLVALAEGGPIWIGLDADPPGEAGALRLAGQLASYPGEVKRLLPPHGAKDFAEVATAVGARESVLRALAGHGYAFGVTAGENTCVSAWSRPDCGRNVPSPADTERESPEAST